MTDSIETSDREAETVAPGAIKRVLHVPVACVPDAHHTLGDLVAFLCGEEPLDGVWFGDPHPTERAMFWWRKYLRAAVAELGAQQLPPSA